MILADGFNYVSTSVLIVSNGSSVISAGDMIFWSLARVSSPQSAMKLSVMPKDLVFGSSVQPLLRDNAENASSHVEARSGSLRSNGSIERDAIVVSQPSVGDASKTSLLASVLFTKTLTFYSGQADSSQIDNLQAVTTKEKYDTVAQLHRRCHHQRMPDVTFNCQLQSLISMTSWHLMTEINFRSFRLQSTRWQIFRCSICRPWFCWHKELMTKAKKHHQWVSYETYRPHCQP